MRKQIPIFILIFNLCMVALYSNVYADLGPKPSLTIYVTNFTSHEYLLDLLVDESYHDFEDNDFCERYPLDYKETGLYRYNEDGWRAVHIHTGSPGGSLEGKLVKKNKMMHKFSGISIPKEFKIIMQYQTGEVVVSDIIASNRFNIIAQLDLETMKIKVVKNIFEGSSGFFIRLLITIGVELIIAAVMKIKPLKVIITTNIVTQILLNAILPVLYLFLLKDVFYIAYVLLEGLIVFIEYAIYSRSITNINKIELLEYSFIANASTFLLGIWLFYI